MALRTSWSLMTLQEHTIMNAAGPPGDAWPIDIQDCRAKQRENRLPGLCGAFSFPCGATDTGL
jgi:hypothetical protein